MAVGTSPPVDPQLASPKSINSGAQPLPSPPESMTSVMSYTYFPPTSQNGAEMGGPPSGYVPPFPVLPGQSTSALDNLPPHDPALPPGNLQLRPLPSTTRPQSDASMMIGGDKKRNRLGYHRTNMACGHCRKRKIRCIPNADTTKPCVSCDRLKKDCLYFPVNETPPVPDARQKSASRAPTGPKNPAAPNSPPISKVKSEPYLPLTIPPVTGVLPPMAEAHHMYTPESKVSSNAPSPVRGYEYPGQPAPGWMGDSDPASKPEINPGLRPAYLQESPLAPSYPPHPAHPMPSGPGWHPPGGDYHHGDGVPYYHPPPRSMSFSGEPSTLYPSRPAHRKSVPSDVYSHPMPGHMPGAVPGTMDHNMPLSAGAVAPPPYGAWPPPPPVHSQQYAYSKPHGDSYQDWYVKHESGGPLHAEEPPMPSSSAEPQPSTASMYYA